MDLVLVPGLWLDGESWSDVVPQLEAAGHTAHPVTLPGMESHDADRSEITLRDHVEAVVELVDQVQDPVVLVGHSGGGAIIYAVADARPDRVVRTVYVDSGPLGDGDSINADLTVVDGEIPLPDWSEFEEQELVGLDEAARREFRAKAIPSPGRVATDQQALQDERRYDIPATVITSTFPGPMLHELIDGGHPFTAELARVKDFEIVDLPTGHWPQVTRPADLAEAIITAVER